MKKVIKIATLALVITALTACSSTPSSNEGGKEYGCSTLNVFNWGEYIGEDTLQNFENEFGVRVSYSLYESNEIMYTQLLGGNKYDILIPSDYMVERLISEGMLQELDLSLIPNLSLLSNDLKGLSYDATNQYSVPYFWGNVGIVYNKTTIDPKLVEVKGYNIFLEADLNGRAFMYDSERDSFMVAMKALGYSMNTEDDAEIQAAYDWLVKVDQTIDPSYGTDEIIDAMATNEKEIAVMYSGDAASILNRNPDMAFYLPAQGTNFWSDSMVIPKTSECADLAHEFINYMLTYEAALSNSSYVGYPSNNQQVLDELSADGGEFYGNEAYLPRTNNDKDEVFKNNEILKAKLSDLWIKVKNH